MTETPGRMPPETPRVVVTIELEGLPRVEVFAGTHEDELRVRDWLSRPTVRRRLLDALADLLDGLHEAA